MADEQWNLCRYVFVAAFLTDIALCGVSLLTMTAISVDRLLALVISVASYTKIFRVLSHHQAQVQDHLQQQPGQPNAPNVARYKKAVNSALWVQLALVVCYASFFIVTIVIADSKTYSSHLVVLREVAAVLVYFNSTLNPFSLLLEDW